MRLKTVSPDRIASELSRRLALRELRRRPGVDMEEGRALLVRFEQRIRTSAAFRRREAEAKALREAEARQLRERLAAERALRDAGADIVQASNKAGILAALKSRREGVRMVIEFGGGGRWILPAMTGREFEGSQRRIARQVGKTSDRVLFEGLAPKAGSSTPAAHAWRRLFAEFCTDREFCNALQLADDAGARVVFGVNRAASSYGYRLPFPYAVEQDIGDGFALVRALYCGEHGGAGRFRVMSLAHGLTATAEHKLPDDALAEFETVRAKAIDAAARVAPNDQDAMRAEFVAADVDQVQP